MFVSCYRRGCCGPSGEHTTYVRVERRQAKPACMFWHSNYSRICTSASSIQSSCASPPRTRPRSPCCSKNISSLPESRLSQNTSVDIEGGTGLVIHALENGFFVAGLVPGAPADHSGAIRINDVILAVGRFPAFEMSSCDEVSQRLLGPVGTTVILRLHRPSNKGLLLKPQICRSR